MGLGTNSKNIFVHFIAHVCQCCGSGLLMDVRRFLNRPVNIIEFDFYSLPFMPPVN